MFFLPFEALSAIPRDALVTQDYKLFVDVRDEKWRSILIEIMSVCTSSYIQLFIYRKEKRTYEYMYFSGPIHDCFYFG